MGVEGLGNAREYIKIHVEEAQVGEDDDDEPEYQVPFQCENPACLLTPKGGWSFDGP